jgi:hypothetical protein
MNNIFFHLKILYLIYKNMGICIIQDTNKLSKHQIQKIKEKVSSFLETNLQDNLQSFLEKDILPHIFPSHSFNDISFEKKEHYEIKLKTVEKMDVKTRLRTQLKNQQMMRKTSDHQESNVWKTYDMLRKRVKKDIKIPSPADIKKQLEIFTAMVDQIQDKTLKNYINQCLSLN